MERKLTAILSADVKGYSRLMADDEEATVRTITAYREVIASLVQAHRGRVVDSPGDNVLAEFPSVVSATECAIEIQHALEDRNAELPDARKMAFRIGLNLGDVIVDGERIYGDGVNIAARVQSLADAGGVCLAGTAYDQVKGKLALAYESLGAHPVKNIAEPVRVYRIRLESGPAAGLGAGRARRPRAWRQSALAVGIVAMGAVGTLAVWALYLRPPPARVASPTALALPDKPSIAVLPFANVSGDPEQEYFSDGITEDLITDLSRLPGLFVIARNSSFTYKGQAVKVQRVGEELGVRYVLEGSVRRAGDRLRITAQLVDAATGRHLWADRYDRDLKDTFALQDELTRNIVAALAVTLTGLERKRAPTESPEAYDAYLRGKTYRWRFTREDNVRARRLFEQAVALDAEYAEAYAELGWTYLLEWTMQWSRDPRTVERASELAQKTLDLDDSLPHGHLLSAHVSLWRKQHDRAIAQAERAMVLSPNSPFSALDLGQILAWAGRPAEAIPLVRQAMRLDPRYAFTYQWALGHAYWLLDRPEEAVAAFQEALTGNPDFIPALWYLAVVYSELGRTAEAQAAMAEVGRLSPGASLDGVRQALPYRDEAIVARLMSSLRRAGFR